MKVTIRFVILALIVMSCSDDENTVAPPALITHYDQVHGWTCAQSVDCQDVYNIDFTAGTIVGIGVVDLTDNSIAQMSLYAPGVPLGGINLFTGTENEHLCNTIGDCNAMPDQVVTDLALAQGGVYRLAVTRNWGESCGGTGTYRLVINSDKRFESPVRTVNDTATLAPGFECPLVTR
jgi:hypothetical protein